MSSLSSAPAFQVALGAGPNLGHDWGITSRRKAWAVGATGLATFVGLVVWLGWVRSTPRNPRVQGRPLSSWFHVLNEKAWFADFRGGPHDPEIARALDAFRALGTNAVPFLLDQRLPRQHEPLATRVIGFLRRNLGLGTRFRPGDAFQFHGMTAGNVLTYLDVPCPVLLAHLEPFLASTNAQVRGAAIAALGHAGHDWEAILGRLRGWLDPADPDAAANATYAVARFGRAATNLVDELVRLAGVASPPHWLPLALGNCGPAAGAALPVVEQRWRPHDPAGSQDAAVGKVPYAVVGGGRLPWALAQARIRPGDPVAMDFLRAVARGEWAGHPERIKPTDLARNLAEVREDGAMFAVVAEEILDAPNARPGGLRSLAYELLSRWDPAGADRRLREEITGADSFHTAVNRAVQLYRLQPTNALARAFLIGAARTNAMLSVMASGAFVSRGDAAPELEQALRGHLADPEVAPGLRPMLGKRVQAMEDLRRRRPRN